MVIVLKLYNLGTNRNEIQISKKSIIFDRFRCKLCLNGYNLLDSKVNNRIEIYHWESCWLWSRKIELRIPSSIHTLGQPDMIVILILKCFWVQKCCKWFVWSSRIVKINKKKMERMWYCFFFHQFTNSNPFWFFFSKRFGRMMA